MDVAFEHLCEQLAVWKCGQMTSRAQPGLATGFPALDAALPGRGWPTSALLELLSDTIGIGELSLLLPAISRISSTKGVVLIAPPFVPYAPAFVEAGVDLRRLLVIHQCSPRDALASAELALRSGACGAVAVWESCLFDRPTQSINYLALRRLHLAADRGNAMAILFRATHLARQPSPAVLRIKLAQNNGQLGLTLFKRRGLVGEQTVLLNPRAARLQEEFVTTPPGRIWSQPLLERLRNRPSPALVLQN